MLLGNVGILGHLNALMGTLTLVFHNYSKATFLLKISTDYSQYH